MRLIAAVFAALAFCLPALAQQSGVVGFDPPNTCVVASTFAPSSDAASTCAPSSYRLYRDGTLVGNITPNGSITFPSASGTFLLGIEAVGARGPGPRVTRQVVVGVPTVPGPVLNVTVSSPCLNASPPCTINVTIAP